MRAWNIAAGGIGARALRQIELPSPELRDSEVKIRVKACALNFRDGAVAGGRYLGGPVQRDTIPLSDGAGEIIGVGAAVKNWRVGDRVMGTFFQNWYGGPFTADVLGSDLGGLIDGMLAEEVVLSEHGIVPIPDHLSYEEASCLPCAALTAWNGLFEVANLRPGQTVAVLGTGGVSIFALQFAKMAGASVIITSSSDDKLARARALGADETINYRRTPEWDEAVLDLTGRRGVDVVVEVGGPGTFQRSIKAAAIGGTVLLIGALTGATGANVEPVPLVRRSVKLQGVYVGSRVMFQARNKAVRARKLQPIIDRVFPFSEAPAGYEYQATGAHFGKIVISLA